MQARVKIEKDWIRCGKCGHKLCRITKEQFFMDGIEFKCHSCKTENLADNIKQEVKEHEEI